MNKYFFHIRKVLLGLYHLIVLFLIFPNKKHTLLSHSDDFCDFSANLFKQNQNRLCEKNKIMILILLKYLNANLKICLINQIQPGLHS